MILKFCRSVCLSFVTFVFTYVLLSVHCVSISSFLCIVFLSVVVYIFVSCCVIRSFCHFLCLAGLVGGNTRLYSDHAQNTGTFSVLASLYNIINVLFGFRVKVDRNVITPTPPPPPHPPRGGGGQGKGNITFFECCVCGFLISVGGGGGGGWRLDPLQPKSPKP